MTSNPEHGPIAPPALYAASVPVLLRYLESLHRIVQAVEALPAAACAQALSARLAADMLPLAAQVQIAVQFALRTACPLAGQAVPRFVPVEPVAAALHGKIDEAMAVLRAMEPSAFRHAATRLIDERAGEAELRLPARQFLHEFALPNFFFHLNMAYALARSHGAALGKGAYDGLHIYPRGA